jgi:hypothetical protein
MNGNMSRDSISWWLTIISNTAVLGGLIFLAYEIRQNTSQLRADSAHSITESVNEVNAALYSDPTLTEIVMKGSQNLDSLQPIESVQFASYQFSRLNIAEYILDLEREGVSDLNFSYVDHVVRQFNERPGLRSFIRQHQETYVGSKQLLQRLLDADDSSGAQ